MNMDVVDLREFYRSRLGRMAARSVSRGLGALINRSDPLGAGERLLALGYPLPYLEQLAPEVERTLVFMPAAQGAIQWPQGKVSSTALVDDAELPLLDASVDRILMVHALEHSNDPHATLHEAWRVLAPNGRLMIVVPNRRGIWARFEHTPFGTGRPYSPGQLTRYLRDAMFSPDLWEDALHFPPSERRSIMKMATGIESAGRRFWPVFAGCTLVLATKRLYQGLPITAKVKRKVFVPVLAPQGNTRR